MPPPTTVDSKTTNEIATPVSVTVIEVNIVANIEPVTAKVTERNHAVATTEGIAESSSLAGTLTEETEGIFFFASDYQKIPSKLFWLCVSLYSFDSNPNNQHSTYSSKSVT